MTITVTIPLDYLATAVTGLILITTGRLTWHRRPALTV